MAEAAQPKQRQISRLLEGCDNAMLLSLLVLGQPCRQWTLMKVIDFEAPHSRRCRRQKMMLQEFCLFVAMALQLAWAATSVTH